MRAEAGALLALLMARVVPPNALWTRLSHAFTHKNHRVREELMACLVDTLTKWVCVTEWSEGSSIYLYDRLDRG